MSVFYLLAGSNHFWHTESYLKIMPHWLPAHKELVYVSGAFEMALAILLLFKLTRPTAAWLIIFLLIAVFPANIQMMLNHLHEGHPNTWITVLRLPLQILLIWWAYRFTKPNIINDKKTHF